MVNISMSTLKHPLSDPNHPFVQEIEKEDKEVILESKLDPRNTQFKVNETKPAFAAKSNETNHLAQPKVMKKAPKIADQKPEKELDDNDESEIESIEKKPKEKSDSESEQEDQKP